MIFWISLVILSVSLIFQFVKFPKLNKAKVFKWAFLVLIIVAVFYYIYLTYAQYILWKNSDGVSKYLVPPYRSITYVIGYHFVRFGLYYLISLAIALIFLIVTKHYNKKFGGRFFELEEPYLGAIAIFLLGNRYWNYAWITYLVLLLVFSAIGTVIYTKVLKKDERFPLYWLWISMAIAALFLGRFLIGSIIK